MHFLSLSERANVTLCVLTLGCFMTCCVPDTQPGLHNETSATLWKIDNVKKFSGITPEVLGQPQLIKTPQGSALQFDGAEDGLILPVNPIAGCREFTIEVLFSPGADGAEAQRFFHIQDAAGRRALLEIRLTKAGEWSLDTFLLDGASSKALHDPALHFTAGKWHWVALRYDGRRLASFVDGKPQLEGEVTFAPMEAGQTSIGMRLNKVYWFKGGIAEARFSSTAISPEQLQRAN